jgi:hypothetical protein
MKFSVRVVEGKNTFQREIEAVSAEAAIRKLNRGRDDAPAHFVFLGRSATRLAAEGNGPGRVRRTAPAAV